jgi:hypothetical protein
MPLDIKGLAVPAANPLFLLGLHSLTIRWLLDMIII